jgi:predicted PurR-regulated permease PerM
VTVRRAHEDDETPQRKQSKRTTVRHVFRVDLSAKTALIAVCTLGAVWALLQIWQILVVIAVGLMLVGMLNPLVERLEARKIPRHYAIAIVFAALVLIAGGFAVLTLPRLINQVSDLFDHFKDSQEYLAKQVLGSKLTAPLAASIRSIQPEAVADKAKEYGITYGPKAAEIAAYAASAFFLALYMIIDRDRMRGSLFSIVPRHYHVRLSRVLINLETIVGGYMRGQAITSLLMSVFTFVVLAIAGVPNALALALFAGLADVLPYVGALLACGPAFIAALSQGMSTAMIVLLTLAAYQEFESRIIIPRVYGRVLRLPAATVMIALLVGGKLMGILGALLALPIAAGIRMIISELRVELPGEDVDDPELRAKDAAAEAEFEERTAGMPAVDAATIATEIATEREAEEHEDEDAKDKEPSPITTGTAANPH